ncbi:hypothetical protein FF2_031218 [Malus domestica]
MVQGHRKRTCSVDYGNSLHKGQSGFGAALLLYRASTVEIVFPTQPPSQPSKLWKWIFAVAGITTTLITYDVFQEKIMRVSYGNNKAFFKYSLFLVFYNRITTSVVWNGVRDGQIPIGYG